MKDLVVNKSVGIPESLIEEIATRAKGEERSFSNMLVILIKRQLESEKANRSLA